MTTKRARKKDSTMLNNQARIKEIKEIKELKSSFIIINKRLLRLEEGLGDLENSFEGLSEWVADIDATVMQGTRKK